jgi:hypothetical protein
MNFLHALLNFNQRRTTRPVRSFLAKQRKIFYIFLFVLAWTYLVKKQPNGKKLWCHRSFLFYKIEPCLQTADIQPIEKTCFKKKWHAPSSKTGNVPKANGPNDA